MLAVGADMLQHTAHLRLTDRLMGRGASWQRSRHGHAQGDASRGDAELAGEGCDVQRGVLSYAMLGRSQSAQSRSL
jgi:hypothetical protein